MRDDQPVWEDQEEEGVSEGDQQVVTEGEKEEEDADDQLDEENENEEVKKEKEELTATERQLSLLWNSTCKYLQTQFQYKVSN